MSKQYTVKEFLALDMVKKKRMQEKNPEQYNKLAKAAKALYDPETDADAAALLASNPKAKKLFGLED